MGLMQGLYRRTVTRLHQLAANEYFDVDDWAPACRHLAAALRHNPLVGTDMTMGRNGQLPTWQQALKPYRLLASHWLALKSGCEKRSCEPVVNISRDEAGVKGRA